MSSSIEDCIFCNKTNCKVISSTKHFFIIRDTAYPVTKHHTLIITHRHVDDYFDLNKEEINELENNKYFKDAVRLRKWDDRGKVSLKEVEELDTYKEMIVAERLAIY